MKKVCLAVLPALTIVLELLPFGAVCIFATSPTERVKETFSYFSLTPFGYANFAPLKLLYPCRSLYNSNTCNRKYFG